MHIRITARPAQIGEEIITQSVAYRRAVEELEYVAAHENSPLSGFRFEVVSDVEVDE